MGQPRDDGLASRSLTFQHSSGSVECKLCLSIHPSYAAYYSHAEGKRHRHNLAALERRHSPSTDGGRGPVKKQFRRIGIPKYDISKIRDPVTRRLGVRLALTLDKLAPGVEPQFRVMSAYEQTVDEVNTNYQYLVVAAEPYESVALRIPAKPIDESRTVAHFNRSDKSYHVQLLFRDML